MRDVITNALALWSSALLRKSGTGRGGNRNREAYGIKKLRELILQLAVRGKLVPQDPNDEPASVLLEKIAKEKARRAKGVKTKKQERQPKVTDTEKSFHIPAVWDWARLGEVVEVVRGITFPASEKTRIFEQGRVACLRTTNVQDQIVWDDVLYVRQKFVARDEQFIRAQDIVMSTANSRELVGKVAIVEDEPDLPTAFGGFLTVLRPILLDSHFVMILLRAPISRNALIDSASQTTNIANISIGKLIPLVLAVPPLAEQHRIVAKVDELMALCDQLEQQQTHSIEAHQTLGETLLSVLTRAASQQERTEAWARIANHFDALFTTELSIYQLKETILQLAVMGKLVFHDPSDEPAGLLLERIARQKQVMLEAKQLRQGKVSRPHTAIDAPAELPSGWRWVNVDSLCFKVTDGTHFTPRYVESGVRFVSAKDIVGGVLTFDRCKFISQEEHEQLYRRCNPEYHDIVISKSGSIGTVALIEDHGEFSLFESLALLKFDQKSLLPQYLVYALTHACASLTTGHIRGVGVKHLHLDILRGIELALPPLAEQHRIVAKVDELMTLCDALKARLADSQATQIRLADATVEQAIVNAVYHVYEDLDSESQAQLPA